MRAGRQRSRALAIGLIGAALIAFAAFAADEWRAGTGASTIPGSTNISDIDTVSYANMTHPLDRVLSHYREGCYAYAKDSASFYVSVGEVTCSNSAGTIRKFRSNTSATTVTWSNLDTGSEATSTTYYYYAVADADATTFTITISANSTSPTGVTYYRKLGAFYNNADGDIEIGGIIEMFSGHVDSIPPGYVLCDGSNGTPDLQDYFIIGAGNLAAVGDSAANALVSGTGSSITMTIPTNSAQSGSGASPAEGHNVMPSYYALAFIMRQGTE